MAFLEVADTPEPTATGLRAVLSRAHTLRVDVLEPGLLRVIVAPGAGSTVDRTWSIRADDARAFTGSAGVERAGKRCIAFIARQIVHQPAGATGKACVAFGCGI